ncbi:hypothetical protein H9L19_04850 [Weissella diestrammenae]|uniref:Uncharacterized protein n=1 Tax=Weissella diestrammenae TaxID=1162633 RepID=A0A7G9T3S6_9LACO|nr:hypothetical protein [Weissella diestrammenae]MCM0582734.1 hypothetical protein [Weissella diestrammenae]QNN74751.1 hypothetical protein H9L19_04850 [Weissella diestrammenae]
MKQNVIWAGVIAAFLVLMIRIIQTLCLPMKDGNLLVLVIGPWVILTGAIYGLHVLWQHWHH